VSHFILVVFYVVYYLVVSLVGSRSVFDCLIRRESEMICCVVEWDSVTG